MKTNYNQFCDASGAIHDLNVNNHTGHPCHTVDEQQDARIGQVSLSRLPILSDLERKDVAEQIQYLAQRLKRHENTHERIEYLTLKRRELESCLHVTKNLLEQGKLDLKTQEQTLKATSEEKDNQHQQQIARLEREHNNRIKRIEKENQKLSDDLIREKNKDYKFNDIKAKNTELHTQITTIQQSYTATISDLRSQINKLSAELTLEKNKNCKLSNIQAENTEVQQSYKDAIDAYEQLQNKIKTIQNSHQDVVLRTYDLQNELAEKNKTIEILENAMKEKDEAIKILKDEIEEKDKTICASLNFL